MKTMTRSDLAAASRASGDLWANAQAIAKREGDDAAEWHLMRGNPNDPIRKAQAESIRLAVADGFMKAVTMIRKGQIDVGREIR